MLVAITLKVIAFLKSAKILVLWRFFFFRVAYCCFTPTFDTVIHVEIYS